MFSFSSRFLVKIQNTKWPPVLFGSATAPPPGKQEDTGPGQTGEKDSDGSINNGQPNTKADEESVIPSDVKSLRRLLRFHRYPPVKLKDGKLHVHIFYFIVIVIQVVKLGLLIGQMLDFADDRALFSSVVNRGHLTLRHTLLKGWDAGMDTPPYPPAHGDFAVYAIDELLESINYAVERFYNAEDDAIGFYKLLSNHSSMTIRMKYFDFPGFNNIPSPLKIRETNFPVDHGLHSMFNPVTNTTTYKYNITEELEFKRLTATVKRLLSIYLDFQVHSVRVHESSKSALCLSINGTVSFVDEDDIGQMVVDLITDTSRMQCSDIGYNVSNVNLANGDTTSKKTLEVVIPISLAFGYVTFLFGLSLGLFTVNCCFMRTDDINESNYFRWREYIKLGVAVIWDVLIIAADTFTLIGIAGIEMLTSDEMLYEFDSNVIYLSIGGLLSCVYILRVFKCHWKCNILLKTLYGAFPAMFAYLISISVLFLGFVLCGYVVLGPYHVKFESKSATVETLFSIINGDELFATLANVEYWKIGNSSSVWWFSRIYIYAYVIVFTIVVLNILIAIFMGAYDEIKAKGQKNEEKLRFGPLEKALYDVVTNDNSDRGLSLRSSLYKIYTEGESDVKTELRKTWKMTKENGTIKCERLREQTLAAYIDADDDYYKGELWRLVFYLF